MCPCSKWNRSRASSTRGAIMVAVLGFIVLLSFILIAFVEDAVSKIKYFGLYYSRDDLRADAYSALDVALAIMSETHEIDSALWSPLQGWGDALELAQFEASDGVSVTVQFVDESGKFPLSPSTEREVYVFTLVELGVPRGDAEEIAASLLDWMDEDDLTLINGMDGDDYESEDPPYYPPNQRIQSWDELRLINGVRDFFFDEMGNPNELNRQFRTAFSLHHNGKVNVNTAPQLVLQVMQVLYGVDGLALLDFRTGGIVGEEAGGGGILSSDANAYGVREEFASYEAETIRVSVEAKRGDNAFLLNALVEYKGAEPAADASTAESSADSVNRVRESGSTARETDAGAALGYPFRLISLTENEKI